MYVKMLSATVVGVEGRLIEVEVDISSGLPQVSVVGLPDPAIRESVERVRAAIQNGGMKFPLDRITVNLAPADMRKEGSAFDLAIAAGILGASGQLPAEMLEGSLLIGELSLNGEVKAVPGVLPMVERARNEGLPQVFVPLSCVAKASLIEGIRVRGIGSLGEWIIGGERAATRSAEPSEDLRAASELPEQAEPDLADVIGQQHGKRALLIAAAGMHNILFVGPPGTGKTMLCRRLPTLLPQLDDDEALAVTKIYSVSGKLQGERRGLIRERPFRSPHHTVSAAGLIGGGPVPKPGEVTLAHHGVLFLDEMPEFPRTALEALRQPLEDRQVTIGRARGVTRFPARFMLAASMNPCPCGYYGADSSSAPGQNVCVCTSHAVSRYRGRMSGPLADRIDLQVEMPRQSSPGGARGGMTSGEGRAIVEAAYERQLHRYRGLGIRWNSELHGRHLHHYASLSGAAEKLLSATYARMGLSFRAHDRILKMARTIADLESSDTVREEHVAEAIQYRCLDRGGS
ncbi:YifB family Mg chelatase-like AAA ATPase [Cohnella thailandensis]|uniref:YifB family Mg chelatase-like AAA ATPase n=1 Tax=Cohnella thailandensis TaxID=557557 RepID=A0A841SXP6_9BACL|nr:YifB family Mg chelatase-like AAA ATPase [Cohnella thailandensis]MBB6636684.1 YifB family Mg chelatase-like AAA ATPase [Cohnella thailandensis]MBP1973440.1 magnesium chelatase family protein [Cohnella thailandensis]